MFKTRNVIAEIFQSRAAYASSVRRICSGARKETIEPDPSAGLESSHVHSGTGEVGMPHYEFVCNACKKTFLKTLTIAEHDAEKTACPHCGSHEVEQRWSAFSAITSKKSAKRNGTEARIHFDNFLLRRLPDRSLLRRDRRGGKGGRISVS